MRRCNTRLMLVFGVAFCSLAPSALAADPKITVIKTVDTTFGDFVPDTVISDSGDAVAFAYNDKQGSQVLIDGKPIGPKIPNKPLSRGGHQPVGWTCGKPAIGDH